MSTQTIETPFLHELDRIDGDDHQILLKSDSENISLWIVVRKLKKSFVRQHINLQNIIDHCANKLRIQLPDTVEMRLAEIVREIFESEENFNTPYHVFDAKAPTPGESGRLDWKVDLATQQPKVDAAGKTNFYDVNNIINVYQGQVIAEILPPTPPAAGVDIFGKPVIPRTPKEIKVRKGKGIAFSDDGRFVIAQAGGGLSVCNGPAPFLSIEEVHTVRGDVDFSTGNINFLGIVAIKGNVLDGFSVKARGDILIEGTVGASTIHSGSNVTIAGGVAGKEKCNIHADGNLQAKYINGATVFAQGNIDVSGEIVNSKVQTMGDVNVPKGRIFNSSVIALGDVAVDTLGSDLGVKTLVAAGTDPKLRQRIADLDRDIDSHQGVYEKIKARIEPYLNNRDLIQKLPADKLEVIRKLAQEMKTLKNEISNNLAMRDELSDTLADSKRKKVKVFSKTCPGIEINIGDCRRLNEKTVQGKLQFMIDEIERVIIIRRLL